MFDIGSHGVHSVVALHNCGVDLGNNALQQASNTGIVVNDKNGHWFRLMIAFSSNSFHREARRVGGAATSRRTGLSYLMFSVNGMVLVTESVLAITRTVCGPEGNV